MNNSVERKDYNVKSFREDKGGRLQEVMTEWIESRHHIEILSINVWSGGTCMNSEGITNMHFGMVTYREKNYEL